MGSRNLFTRWLASAFVSSRRVTLSVTDDRLPCAILGQMPRYFTLQQAEQVLPEVEAAVLTAIGLKSAYQEAAAKFQDLTHRVMMSGGMAVNRESAARLRQMRDQPAQRLQDVMREIEEFGCMVKDLDIGLLDFPTLYRGQEVYLCWRLGETGIRFWHGVQEGFRGRKAIDEEFLANHRGDSPV